MKAKEVSLLLSGGIDSTACLYYYVNHGFATRAVHINYGQLAATQELRAVKQITDHFDIALNVITLKGLKGEKKDYIIGRNAFLLMTALMECPESNMIAIGIHGGTSYSDCTVNFIEQIQRLFDLYTKGSVQVAAPFLAWTKKEIYDYCKTNRLPLEITYSCEYGKVQPCGLCLSCRDLEALQC
ncbi:MAG: 7-cyano-7-deazaguanine synthase [Planctomycetaceae bacterium]|nr:7-cyano-7-deazaguanine synthase [Planctomycetaceae bacterium]